MKHFSSSFAAGMLMTAACVLVFSSTTVIAAATVYVYGQHVGPNVIYNYRIVNDTQYHIPAIWIGWNTRNNTNPEDDGPELTSLPIGWDRSVHGAYLPPGTFTAPTGWGAEVITQEETEEVAVVFRISNNDHSFDVRPGQTLTGLSITLDKPDESYLKSHAGVTYSDGKSTNLTLPLARFDTTPPDIMVSVSPATISAAPGSLVTVKATVTTKDDYDPSPAIKLHSISSNQTLTTGDVVGAEIGKDDREFQLRIPTGTTGRLYHITYSATDATGNRNLAAATVTVK